MFTLKYRDRQYFEGYDGIWGRVVVGEKSFDVGTQNEGHYGADLRSRTDYYTLHLGKDLLHNNDYTFGVMGAYGYTDGSTRNLYTGEKVDHSSQGFALGAYGSYEFNEKGYIDVWAQYVMMRNKVEGLKTEKYNSKGLVASVEAGYTFEVTDTFRIVPQAQVIWMDVKADNHTDSEGRRISSNSGNVQTRIGARFFSEGQDYSPYAEVNYIHNSKDYSVNFSENGAEMISAKALGAKDLYQLELGIATKPKNGWTAEGSAAFTKGRNSYQDVRVKINLRYDF